jgi:hypothetical protein
MDCSAGCGCCCAGHNWLDGRERCGCSNGCLDIGSGGVVSVLEREGAMVSCIGSSGVTWLTESREWYHDAQQRRYIYDEADEPRFDDTIPEEDEDGFESPSEHSADEAREPKADANTNAESASNAQKEARDALKRSELMAFIGCFLGPLLGALLMHTIRGQLASTRYEY